MNTPTTEQYEKARKIACVAVDFCHQGMVTATAEINGVGPHTFECDELTKDIAQALAEESAARPAALSADARDVPPVAWRVRCFTYCTPAHVDEIAAQNEATEYDEVGRCIECAPHRVIALYPHPQGAPESGRGKWLKEDGSWDYEAVARAFFPGLFSPSHPEGPVSGTSDRGEEGSDDRKTAAKAPVERRWPGVVLWLSSFWLGFVAGLVAAR